MALSALTEAQFVDPGSIGKDEGFMAAMPIAALQIDEDSKTELLSITPSTALVAFVEPITWAAIARMGLGALVSAGVSGLLGSLFGGKSKTKALLRSFFQQVLVALAQQLDEQWLKQVEAQLDGLKSSFEAYARSSESLGAHLPHIIINADRLDAEAKALGVPAIGVATVASTLRLAAYIEQARVSGTDGDKETVWVIAREYNAYLDEMEKEVIRRRNMRFTGLWSRTGASYNRIRTVWNYKKDGQWCQLGSVNGPPSGSRYKNYKKTAEEQYNKDRAETLKVMMNATIVPARAVTVEMRNTIDAIERRNRP